MGLSILWLYALIAFLIVVVGLGVVLGYHRVLTHRAAVLDKWLEYVLITFALPAGTPIQWIGNHRFHHTQTDTPADRHSPIHYGFWQAHVGWYIYTANPLLCLLYALAGPLRTVFDAFWRPRTNQEHVNLAKDIANDAYYAWVSRPIPYASVVLGYEIALWGGCLWAFGTDCLLPLYGLHIFAYNVGDLVNSAGHLWGKAPFYAKDASKNLGWLGFLAFGDGYHNGHHAFPASIRCGLLPWQIDGAYLFCQLFAKLGWARDLYVPPAEHIALSMRQQEEFLRAQNTHTSVIHS